MSEITTIALAAAGGILPALAWLWFWLQEDSSHPEPRRLIVLAFFVGMVAVAIAIPLQKGAATFFSLAGTSLYVAWSAIEEVVKYFVASVSVLKTRYADEPIDMVIYMVIVALGFAAAENALFLVAPLTGSEFVQTILTGNLRFMGATLLHVVSSAVIGVALALAFYKSKHVKRLYLLAGVILAIALHSGFNFLILNTPDTGVFRTFGLVWIGVAVLLGVLELIKRMYKRRPKNK